MIWFIMIISLALMSLLLLLSLLVIWFFGNPYGRDTLFYYRMMTDPTKTWFHLSMDEFVVR